MLTYLPVVTFAVALVLLILGIWILLRLNRASSERIEPVVREELRGAREEAASQARALREEVVDQQVKANTLLVGTLDVLANAQRERLEEVASATRMAGTQTRDAIETLVSKTNAGLTEIRTATDTRLEAVRNTIEGKLAAGDKAQEQRNDDVIRVLEELTKSNREALEKQKEALRLQLQDLQGANDLRFDQMKATLEGKLRQGLDDQRTHLGSVMTALTNLEKGNQAEQDKSRGVLDQKLTQIQESNEKKLDEMRATVDEKLHKTLETRLGEAFKLVSDKLEAVQKGLGEMQGLAGDVGGLKRALTNVKIRGAWGEFQLAAILEQLLAPDQYASNVQPKSNGERVEFAVRLPGQGQDPAKPVWLPIDSKFPKEDYERLVEASQNADVQGVEASKQALLAALRKSAKDIHAKYISPPETTDFAIMFLPTEGLYAEALREPGFGDELYRNCRVLIAGPTTLSAILTSLRVGFQTLAIERRAHEIWDVLRGVKSEFSKFGLVLEKVKKQLATASNSIDETATRTRAIERRLRGVETLPVAEAGELLALPEIAPVADAPAEDSAALPEPNGEAGVASTEPGTDPLGADLVGEETEG